MPALLAKEEEEMWLDPTLPEKEIQKLLKPFDENEMVAYPVNKNILRMNPKEKRIIEPVAQ